MSGTLKPGGRALIVSKSDEINTGREVTTVAPAACLCGRPAWSVLAVGRPLMLDFFGRYLPVDGRIYHAADLMPLDGDPDEVGDVDVKKPEDVTA